jgi:hydrogenase-4 component F
MLGVAAIALPLGAAVLAAIAGWRRWVAWVGAACAWGIVGVGAALAVVVLDDGPVEALGGALRVDALGAFMTIVVGSVAGLATWASVPYVERELADGATSARGARWYAILIQLFVAAMVLALLASNIGVTWVAIEATTIVTVFLVGHRRTRASLEASWKYVIIGSTGIVFAFCGIALVAYAGKHAGIAAADALDWPTLVAGGTRLSPDVMRFAIVLVILGYGTKVGLAPVHTWLPDAHSQAPAPVSALMSGVLLAVAFTALWRLKRVADLALGQPFTRGLLVAAGLLSLAVAASLLLAQRDYKRMLAYSSIEHMGLLALAAAIGTPLAAAAGLLHILAHGLGKTALFLGSGELLHAEGTTRIDSVRGLLVRRPALGALFAAGLVAIAGLPPFGLFASEVALVRAGFASDLGWVMAIALVLVLVVFGALLFHGQRMLLGEPAEEPGHRGAAARGPLVPIGLGLAALALLGVTVYPIQSLLDAAARVVAP